VFFTLLEIFAKKRSAIAIETGTQNAVNYGIMRNSEYGANAGME
jgi:hypothetical protein